MPAAERDRGAFRVFDSLPQHVDAVGAPEQFAVEHHGGHAEHAEIFGLLDDAIVPGADAAIDDLDEIPDDRLRLICTCCHPAIALEAQVALTLRLLCGLSTGEVARAFLVSEPTMAARLTRAKKKISGWRPNYWPIPKSVPST